MKIRLVANAATATEDEPTPNLRKYKGKLQKSNSTATIKS
jgi:hypothetical protein